MEKLESIENTKELKRVYQLNLTKPQLDFLTTAIILADDTLSMDRVKIAETVSVLFKGLIMKCYTEEDINQITNQLKKFIATQEYKES